MHYGNYNPNSPEKINRIGQLRYGVKKRLDNECYSPDLLKSYVVADMITGFGVAESIVHYYNIWGGDILGKKVIVQGWGNVGSSAAYYLSKKGAKIVGIIDKDGGQINTEGFSFNQIKNFFLNKDKNTFVSNEIESFDNINSKIWDLNADVFIPCAASRIVAKDQVDRMINSGLELISSGANVPFADNEVFFGPICEYVDSKISVIPDFISNCGMARAFAYLMDAKVDITDKGIFEDCSKTIYNALIDCYKISSKKEKISSNALEIALKKLLK